MKISLKEAFLQENVGGVDLYVRALIGSIATIALAMDLVETYPWNWITALIALVGLFTAMTRHCTPYSFIRYSTVRK
ncbi:DUF2892 domain-containing protein [Methanohalobium sp.]|uniref:YgaP family membrane protein n=1 Tax=Methanohalobium sp. TaxID=2837493 RepID=UPI0025F88B09|nr:DUF2892 domain-containing protein [Methanohalobium sp.]